MEYFGISNKDPVNDPFIKDFNKFPFILEKDLLNTVIIEEKEMVLDNTNYHNCSVPILYEYRNNAALKVIWNGIKNGDIVTNRGAKRSLAADKRNQKIERKVVNVNGDEKSIYLVTRGQKKKLSVAKFNSGFQAEKNVFKRSLNDYTIYGYAKTYNRDLQCFEHYTSEIDGFIKMDGNDNYAPVEFKSMRSFRGATVNSFERSWNIDAVIQCRLAGINNVIIGYRNDNEMKLQRFYLDEFESNVKNSVQCSLLRMNRNMKELVRNKKVLDVHYPRGDKR
uniref:Decapping nuclease n=1 Tax=Panagrolaimus superbus TaxID=310955 RepID=A0A914ZB28_9BILA